MNLKSLFFVNGTVAAASLCLISPARLQGATANVTVEANLTFQPASTSINVGDTVLWTWPSGSDDHNVTSTSAPQSWTASSTVNGPATFSHTFSAAGTFPYECTIHAAENMKAVVTVAAAANVPPTVTITNPASGTVFQTPANVSISATASDSDATVTSVQFLNGTTVLATVTAAPFKATDSSLATGNYTLSAVATDSVGLKNTNSVAISVVTPVPITVSAVQQSPGNFQFSYAANTGLSYVVQKTTNLMVSAWVPVSTNKAAASSVIFTDSHATNNPGFYRVGLMPNP